MDDDFTKKLTSDATRAQLMRQCAKYTKDYDTQQELVQLAMEKAWKRRNTYIEEGKFKYWIGQIQYHTFVDYFRRKKRRPLPPPTDSAYQTVWNLASGISDPSTQDIDDIKILKIIEQMEVNPKHKATLMRILSGFSHKESAEMGGHPVNTSTGNARYARETIKKICNEDINNLPLDNLDDYELKFDPTTGNVTPYQDSDSEPEPPSV